MRDRYIYIYIERDLDTSHIPGHSFIPKPLSVFPGTIRHEGYIRTLA